MEALLHHVWKHRLWQPGSLRTADGQRVEVVDSGVHNTDAGPDFFKATVQVADQMWVGNVEIHVRASDWYRHNHHTDPAYATIVLHVVQYSDAEIRRPDGSVIPQVEIKCSPLAAERCNRLVNFAPEHLPCSNVIAAIAPIYHTDWLTNLAMERLYEKSERISALAKSSGGYWDQAAYVTLARALGFGLNGQAFETLAMNLPLAFLAKHRDNMLSLEALMFGQAGLIPQPAEGENPYITHLRTEYAFLRHKFSLTPLPIAWKMARTRPGNFPHRRIALLAQMVHNNNRLLRSLEAADDIEAARAAFAVNLMGFWANHYSFNDSQGATSKALSQKSVDILLINVAIPLLHARAMAVGDIDGMERAATMLQSLPPEDNAIVRLFTAAGLRCTDAFASQAMVQLRREYCQKRKCIYCRFGHHMLTSVITNTP